ncbi:MAG: GNAT family N-acetyltransferase [Sphingomonadaceae bacterium]|nr:GNAT family N-acetyltransferase [Sphingomonadaceae bacterium]
MGYGELIAIEYHADLKEVQLDARLSALLSPAQQHAPFDRLDWLQGLATSCNMEPIVATAHDDESIIALPLRRSDNHLTSLANYYTFRFRPLTMQDSDPKALLGALARDLADKTHRITLKGVPDEDGSASLLENAFRNAGWTVIREQCDYNHVLPLNGRSWEEYFAKLPGKLRTTIKRKGKKVDCRIIERFDEDAWRSYEAIYAQSWKPEEGSIEFLHRFAEQEGEAGRLRLGIASADGEDIAAQIWTVEGGTAYIHKLAYRSSAHSLSPGSVLSAALFRHVIDQDKVQLVDYGTGDDGYKRDWMEEVRPRYLLDIFRPTSPKNWIPLAKTGLRRLAGNSKRG